MRISTAGTCGDITTGDIERAFDQLTLDLGGTPDLLIVHHSASLRSGPHEVLARRSGGAPLIGSTTCRGAMTESGMYGLDDSGLALLGLCDVSGDYGTAWMRIDGHPDRAARRGLSAALAMADRPGELPELVWVQASPGYEEAIVAALDNATGGHAAIVGGSAADDSLDGEWLTFANGEIGRDGVAIAVLFPSTTISVASASGYSPTNTRGSVTSASGREIIEIDGRPAAIVFDEWTGGSIAAALGGGDARILSQTANTPLGVSIGDVAFAPGRTVRQFSLVHPHSVTEGAGLETFARIGVGEEIRVMSASAESLISRGPRVAHNALRASGSEPTDIAGCLVVYGAGCMLAVGDRMSEVVEMLNLSFGGAPFVGAFTFGEQGAQGGGRSRHGNLMVSVVVFHSS